MSKYLTVVGNIAVLANLYALRLEKIISQRKMMHLVSLSLVLLFLQGCYVSKLAWHQNNLFNSRRLVKEVVSDVKTSEKVKKKLRLLLEVLEFAKNEGLATDSAYQYYIHSEQRYVSYLVQAAHPDKLKSVTWWFPIVGTVPYKGFFAESDRNNLAKKLSEQGYDIFKTGAGAFSSLGWFDDPVYSSMINRRTSSLAHLFFHELTHRTFWWAGSAKFNENLAEYLAGVLTEKFLKHKGLEKGMKRYRQIRTDKKKYKIWLKDLRKSLRSLYENSESLTKQAILVKKKQLFDKKTKLQKPEFIYADYVGKEPWNNARVLGASLYSPNTERFAKAYSCMADLNAGEFLEKLKLALKDTDNQFDGLDSLCGKK